ncbi:MAG: aldo/keto reductase [Parahaliea sp.]
MSNRVSIGSTGLSVNPVGFGTNTVGGHNLFGPQDEAQGKALVRQAIEAGIDFFDTAYIYGPERSEVLTGEAIAEMGVRERVVIATKAAHVITDQGVHFDNSPAFLQRSVEDSLRRLGTDYIDLFYIHMPDGKTPEAEAVGALQSLREQGKIRAIGVSNFSLEQLQRANRDGHVDVVQSEYSLLHRAPERDLLPYIVERGMSFVPYFPLACGLLAGKYRPDTSFGDFRADMPLFQPAVFAGNLSKVENLRPIASTHGVEVAQIALAWCLAQPGIDAIIPGAKNAAQLEGNVRTDSVVLSATELKQLDRAFRP